MNTNKIRVADYVADFLKKKKIDKIFMLTGYGAMYLNDAIKLKGIKYFAARNEAAAPMMAEAFARASGKVGAVCVTAGPGATNAIPGLAEAYVDSAPIIIISGQVEKKHTTHFMKIKNLRTYGTAEINIIPIVKPLTKFSAVVDTPNSIRYLLEKAYSSATSGRPGPVWLDIPLDVQQALVNPNKLRSFKEKKFKGNKNNIKKIKKLIKIIKKSSSPILVVGNGVRQSNQIENLKKIIKILKIPVFFSRLGQDIISHDKKYIYGQAGVKGSLFCKKIMEKSDLLISFGSRLAVQFLGLKKEAISKKCKICMIDVDSSEIIKTSPYFYIKQDLKDFIPDFYRIIKKEKKYFNFQGWNAFCEKTKSENPIILQNKRNPIDLYYFMSRLGDLSPKNSFLITDAGSNYYIGGQVWKFKKNQREITSGCNAAMGLSIPLAIGAGVAKPKDNILAVTGDGSLELNIQELKTISHYNLNIKLFVINNGGYVSMIKWQDTVFSGRRLDTKEFTGAGTLNLKKIANAFDLKWYLIKNVSNIDKDLKKIFKIKGPLFVEVVTDNKQKIQSGFKNE